MGSISRGLNVKLVEQEEEVVVEVVEDGVAVEAVEEAVVEDGVVVEEVAVAGLEGVQVDGPMDHGRVPPEVVVMWVSDFSDLLIEGMFKANAVIMYWNN